MADGTAPAPTAMTLCNHMERLALQLRLDPLTWQRLEALRQAWGMDSHSDALAHLLARIWEDEGNAA